MNTMQFRPVVIGIMGPGEQASRLDCDTAFEIGKMVASSNYVVLTGGRNCGVMNAALKGAKEAGGTTIGILPGDTTEEMSPYVDIPIVTGMGNARNVINVLSSQLVVAIGESPGTLSEIVLAFKTGKPVLALNLSKETTEMLSRFPKNNFIRLERFEKQQFMISLKKLMDET